MTGKARSHDHVSKISAEVRLGSFASQSHGGTAGVDQFILAINIYLLNSYCVPGTALGRGNVAVHKSKSLFHGAWDLVGGGRK